MSISYDSFTGAFLAKITEFDLLEIAPEERDVIMTGYMRRAMTKFAHVSKIDFAAYDNPAEHSFDVEGVSERDIEEVVDIISDGMIVEWLKPYVNKQELLENVLNTRDYNTYSSANLLLRVRETYKSAQADYTQRVREYSYAHGDLTVLHL